MATATPRRPDPSSARSRQPAIRETHLAAGDMHKGGARSGHDGPEDWSEVSAAAGGGGSIEEEEEEEEELRVGVGMPNLASVLPRLRYLPDALSPVLNVLGMLGAASSPGPGLPEPIPSANGNALNLTVVLDLDETLVHCRLEQLPVGRPNFSVSFEDTDIAGFVYIRPAARLFLEVAARLFEVVVFTASSQAYADQVLDQLDPEGKLLSGRLYRQHCTSEVGGFLKDLRSLGRPMERAVLVDNSPVSLVLCPDNGVLVSSWTAEEEHDQELMHLLLLLQDCAQQPSVPAYLRERYGLYAFLEELRTRSDYIVGDEC